MSKGFTPILILVIVLLVAGIAFVAGQGLKQGMPIQVTTSSTTQPSALQNESKSFQVAGPEVENTTLGTISPNCLESFNSQYLKLSFQYDKCAWSLEEVLNPDAGIYSMITATANNKSGFVYIRAGNIGMGGYYPGCELVSKVSLLDNGITRIQMAKDLSYTYLTTKNDVGIKDYNAKDIGNEKFENYFTFLNPNAFPNTNMCWRSGGINTVAKADSKPEEQSYERLKEIDVALNVSNSSPNLESFLRSADNLAESIYTK